MTFKQMEYALTIAKCASLSEAAKQLYVSQPSLSESIKKLEAELGYEIFAREHNGVTVTSEGQDFLVIAQNIIDQVGNIEKKSQEGDSKKLKCTFGTIHYYFMGEVLAKLVNELQEKDYDGYDVSIIDLGTIDIIEAVANGSCEIGVISYTDHNRSYILKELRKRGLDCTEIHSTRLNAFFRKGHPVGDGRLTMHDLEPYPYVSVWQDQKTQYFFNEEGIFLPANTRKIFVNDSGIIDKLLETTDAFAVGCGIIPAGVSSETTYAVPISDAPISSTCWIRRGGQELSPVAKRFIEIMKEKLS